MIRILFAIVLSAITAFQFWLPLCLAQTEEGFVYDPEGKRDPFIPLVSKEGVYLPEFQMQIGLGEGVILEGILWDPKGKDSRAIINGVILQEGEEFGNIKVLKIERDRIRLLIGEEESTVELFSEEDE